MKSMKKVLSLLLVLVMIFSLTACGGNEGEKKGGGSGKTKKLGLMIYDGGDNYIATVRQAVEAIDEEDDSIEVEIVDGQGNQATQTEQLDALIAKKVDMLLINIVDFKAAKQVIATVKDSGIPALFFNRDITADLTKEDLDQMIFFGTVAPQAGVYQGEMALDYWKNNESADRNGDGKLQYVMLHGGLDNDEAKARTEESIKVFTDNGIEVEEIGMQVADWNTEKAKEAVDAWMAKDGDRIEMIFANNDGMAFGAISALKDLGYNSGDDAKYIPVWGVDALAEAIQKIEAGEMAGTVKQSSETMARGIIDLAKNKLDGNDWTEGIDYEIYDDGVSVRMDYEKITQ